MATKGKDTIYIDVDDEITTIIDKVRSSKERIVALVLPKRATTFQSSVNMKLLKRTADEDHKHVVLITSEAGLLPLAAAAGLHVADSLQSKPEIPNPNDESPDSPQSSIEEAVPVAGDEDFNSADAANKSVGELAGVATGSDDIETLQVEEEKDEADEADKKDKTDEKKEKTPKNRKLHVPNFNKFRISLMLGVLLLIIIIFGGYFAFHVLPKAVISIKTDSSAIPTTLSMTLDTTATALNSTNNTVPAQTQQQQKTYTQQVPTTGQQNNGSTATGSITFTALECGTSPFQLPEAVAAGTGVATGGKNFITQQTTNFTFTGAKASGSCYSYPSTSATPVTAQAAGTAYNFSSANFTVAGRSDVTGNGSTSGGTDNIVSVVSQNDITNAEQKLSGQSTTAIEQALEQQLQQDGLVPIDGSFVGTTPSYSSDNQVGDVASNVTVTENITYSMYGAKQSYLNSLVENQVKQQINPSDQSILNTGIGSATTKVTGTGTSTITINLTTTVIAGPNLSITAIKKEVEGLKSGDVKTKLENVTGVTSVDVDLSPFWVGSVPSNPSKITVNLGKPVVSRDGSS